MSKTVKGWKCFDRELKCKGFQFEVGKTYEVKGPIKMCESGFHFHEVGEHIFHYYGTDSRVCEIEAHDVITDVDKSVCRKIKIVKELSNFFNIIAVRYGNGDGYGNGYG